MHYFSTKICFFTFKTKVGKTGNSLQVKSLAWCSVVGGILNFISLLYFLMIHSRCTIHRRFLIFKILWLILLSLKLSATVHRVGPSLLFPDPYTLSISGVLNTGDTVLIAPGTYTGQAATALWTASHLLIRGKDGIADMEAGGHHCGGKAIWVIAGDHVTVENIGFYNCSVPDRNGAGIRSEGKGLTIRHCRFAGNENGVLSNSPYAGHILIELSEFGYNGYGDGYSHNVYINHIDTLTFRFNYSHHAKSGHHVKSRAACNIILCNRISDEKAGNSSRLIDLPNGGFAVISGNVLMQGPVAENNNLVGFGMEGLTNPVHAFYLVNNTLVNKREASCRFLQLAEGTGTSAVVNNIFAGKGIMVEGTPAILEANLAAEEPGYFRFRDEAVFDYRLNAGSPAIDTGIDPGMANGVPLMPQWEYIHPADSVIRTNSGKPDIGAFGDHAYGAVQDALFRKIFLYPNPAGAGDLIKIEGCLTVRKILLIGTGGHLYSIECKPEGFRLPSTLPAGVYFVGMVKGLGLSVDRLVVVSL